MSEKDVFGVSLGGGAQRLTPKPKAKLSLMRNQEATQAVSSKLVEGFIPRQYDRKGNRQTIGASPQLSRKISSDTARMVSDAKNMLETLPDLEMVKQILVASILSPQDLMGGELNFSLSDDKIGEIGAPLLALITDFFKGTYKIEPLLPKMLEDALFMTGSYPLAVLPESTIDDVINSNDKISIESLMAEYNNDGKPRPYGILGNPNGPLKPPQGELRPMTGLESVFGGPQDIHAHELSSYDENNLLKLSVTDNPMALRTPMLKDKVARQKIAGIYEAHSINARGDGKEGVSDMALKQLFKRRNYQFNPTLALKTQDQLDKPTYGHPLVMKLPSESVIPVHVPGDPTQHIGYYVLLDLMGNPLTLASELDRINNVANNVSSNTELKSGLLRAANRAQNGREDDSSRDVMELEQLYMQHVEDDLLARLRNGVYGDNVKVSRPTEVYRIMFARACAGQHTQLLYLPTDFMTYITFDYNEFGVGRSLIEATKTVGVIRALLMVANTMAAIKNSTNHVNLDINLDPDDPDPAQRVEQLVHEYVKTRQFGFPDRITSPADLSDYIQAGGVSVTVSGNTGYPETKMTVEGRSSERAEVNSELDEAMKKRHYLGFGVSPEMVDRSMSEELATSLIQQNLLMAKRVMVYGREFCAFLTDHIQKYTLNSRKLMDKMREIIRSMDTDKTTDVDGVNGANKSSTVNTTEAAGGAGDSEYERKVDLILMHFINSIQVTLPEPDLTKVDLQLEAFEKYSEGLDKVLPAFINSDMFDSNAMGELSNSIPMTIGILKAHFQRRWLKNKNVFPEMFELITFTEQEGPVMNLLKDHQSYMEGLEKSLMDFMQKALKVAKANNKTLEEANGGEELAETEPVGNDAGGDSGGSDDLGGGADDGFGDFDMGGDDLGGGADAEGADAEADADTPPEEEADVDATPDEGI